MFRLKTDFECKMEQDFDALNERCAKMHERTGSKFAAQCIRSDYQIKKTLREWNPPIYSDIDRKRVKDELEEHKAQARQDEEDEHTYRAQAQARQDKREHNELRHRLKSMAHVQDKSEEPFTLLQSLAKRTGIALKVLTDTFEYLKADEGQYGTFIEGVVEAIACDKVGDPVSAIGCLVAAFDPVDRSRLEKLGRKMIWLLGPGPACVEISTRVMEGHCVRSVELHKKIKAEYIDLGYTDRAADIATLRDLDFEGDHDNSNLQRMIDEIS